MHVSNHVLAIVSLDTHLAVLRALRVVYRERLIEIALVTALVIQASTGLTMVWKSRLRRTTTFRNLQTVSGLFLSAFLYFTFIRCFFQRGREWWILLFPGRDERPRRSSRKGGPDWAAALRTTFWRSLCCSFIWHVRLAGTLRESCHEPAARKVSV